MGATHACGPDDLEDLMETVAQDRFDWTFEAVGSTRVFEVAYRATGRGGGTVSMGLAHPDALAQLPAVNLVAENRKVLGSYMGTAQPAVDVPAMVALWEAGRLPVDRMVSDRLPPSDINPALDALASGRAVRQVVQCGSASSTH